MPTLILDAVASILQTNGLGTIGTTLFKGLLPDAIGGTLIADSCLGVFEYAAGAPTRTMNRAATAIERPRISVICRAPVDDYLAARLAAAQVRRVLGAVADTTVDGLTIYSMSALNHPEPLGVDHKQRPMVSVAFEAFHTPEVLT